jgi:tetratricopeptide (TPR) repeat protein
MFYNLKRYDEAISYYDKALEINPSNASVLNDIRSALEKIKTKK